MKARLRDLRLRGLKRLFVAATLHPKKLARRISLVSIVLCNVLLWSIIFGWFLPAALTAFALYLLSQFNLAMYEVAQTVHLDFLAEDGIILTEADFE